MAAFDPDLRGGGVHSGRGLRAAGSRSVHSKLENRPYDVGGSAVMSGHCAMPEIVAIDRALRVCARADGFDRPMPPRRAIATP
jgi:hypothetical protein